MVDRAFEKTAADGFDYYYDNLRDGWYMEKRLSHYGMLPEPIQHEIEARLHDNNDLLVATGYELVKIKKAKPKRTPHFDVDYEGAGL